MNETNMIPPARKGMTTTANIVVTETVRDRLEEIIASHFVQAFEPQEYLERLKDALSKAEVVHRKALPVETVTVGSIVGLRELDCDKTDTYALVYPEHADIENNRLSVLAPIGAALLGHRVGETIRATVPNGTRTLRIECVQNRTGVRVSLATKPSEGRLQNHVDFETKPIPELYFG